MCDCEPASVYKESKRTAKKSHVCKECGITISKGDHYISAKYLVDGEWSAYKICEDCDRVAKRFEAVCGECYQFTQLFDELKDCEFIIKRNGLWVSQEKWLEVKNQNPLQLKETITS